MLALYVGIFLVSAAALFFELTLTRIFAVTQWYHFAFISVSVALLGFGASGTWLALAPVKPSPITQQARREHRLAILRLLSTLASLFALTILLAYLAVDYVPFDSYRVAWERRQLLYLAVYYSALIVPFIFAGACIGLPLTAWAERANALYAANLAGSAVGSLLGLVAVPLLGGSGAMFCASSIAMAAVCVLSYSAGQPRAQRLFYLTLCAAALGFALRPPAWAALRLSAYKTLSISLLYPEARLTFSGWNAFSRVDVVDSAGIHSAPGLSLSYTGQFPRQLGLLVDGGDLSPLTCGPNPADELLLEDLPAALPFALRPQAQALVIEPRGGLDLLVALHAGASSVVAIESNPLVVSAARAQSGTCGASPYTDARVQTVSESPRSYLRRSPQRFDVVLLSLSDTYQPVMSGAYSLSESYAYTVEAFAEYLRHLREDGLLVVTRWLQSPPSEEVRACLLLAEALARVGVAAPSTHVLAFRSWSTAMLLAKRIPFGSEEIARWKVFCEQRGFDLIYYDGMSADEGNRYNVLTHTAHFDAFREILTDTDRQGFLQQYPYDVLPPTDDRPFFFHYFRWEQTSSILRGLGRTWQPFGGSGFLIIVVLLLLVTVLSGVLILLPLAARNRPRAPQSVLFLAYFACLGMGYLLVEMPLLQQFILFLGQPAYSFALVLFSLLLFSGVGSMLSDQLPVRWLLLLLVGLVLVYPVALSRLFARCIAWGLPPRLLVAALSLGPLGFLLGLPFPAGVRLLRGQAALLIPWAWAVNGCAAVIGSIVAVLGSVTFGFSRVLIAGAFAYLAGWVIITYLQPHGAREWP